MSKVRPKPAAGKPWWTDTRVCLLLLLAILAVYSQVRHFEFVNYDDADYVGKNSHVLAGPTAAGVAWAVTSFHAANWFPLTWLSHMLDVRLFGVQGGWHHVTNVVLHSLATLLLFAALKRMTGARWRSAFVAFVFALHPLHVESVAWVAERKDVLSALFWCLTMWCHARYVQRPGIGRYLAVVLAFACGLMAKPMIITLPVVLLLLDVWPLRRAPRWALLGEKVPLFALAAGVSVLTFLAQRQGGAVAALSVMPLPVRAGNALVSYVGYLRDLFWPAALGVFYPYPRELAWGLVAAAALTLAVISWLVARQFRARPYLAVGWCWYLVTLLPVIGLVQVGAQARADRYTYLPMVGISLMLAWGAADLIAWRPQWKIAVLTAAFAAAAACMVTTWFQIQYWANSESLFLHAIAVTGANAPMRNNLANYYVEQQRLPEAREQAAAAVGDNPGYVDARVTLASVLSRLGQTAESEQEYRRALQLQPSNAEAHSGLGAVLCLENRTAEAMPELQAAVTLKPHYAEGHYNLGKALAAAGRGGEAMAEFSAAIRLQPGMAAAHQSLAFALAAQGRMGDAMNEFAAEVQLRPGDANAQYNLGLALANLGRLEEAVGRFSEALRLRPDFEAARKSLELARTPRR